MPEDEMHRTRHALVELGERMGNGLAAGGVVTAIEPDLGPLPDISVERAVAQALKPRRPFGVGQPLLDGANRQGIAKGDARRGDGSTCIVDLMPAVEARQRQVDQPRCGLEDQPAMLLEHVEVAAEHMQRRADLLGARFDHLERFPLLAADDAGHARLEDACLLTGDGRKRVAEKRDVIDGDRRDRRGKRLVDHIGRVEPAAKAGFQEQQIGRRLGEGKEGRGGGDLEQGDQLTVIGGLGPGEAIDQHRFADGRRTSRGRQARRAHGS